MSQAEILEFLEKDKEHEFNAKEIHIGVPGISASSIHHNLSKLRHAGLVDCKADLIPGRGWSKLKYKHRENGG